MKRRFSRRDVLKGAQVAGLAGVAGGLAGVAALKKGEVRTQGVCRICTMHCGLLGTVRGGRLVRVEGDPDSKTKGFICHHGWALREVVHSPDRLQHPLVRLRDGRLVRTTWKEALEGIASRMRDIRARWGAQAIALQAGWPFVRHPMLPFFRRFVHAFGSPNFATVASLCASAGHMARMMVTGSFTHAELKGARSLIVWGANPAIADPPLAHLVAQKRFGKGSLIVVDPTRTELAEQATVHLRPRPGSDAALALGMLNVLIEERLFDAALVADSVTGFDALAERVRSYAPAEVERLTSVPVEDLVRAVRLFATQGPGAVWDSLGVQHHVDGVQTARAIACLTALCGYVDVPGGMKLLGRAGRDFWESPLPTFYRLTTPQPVPEAVEAKPIGYDRFPLFELFNREAQGLLFPNAILNDEPYPLRGLICFASNPLVTYPQAAKWSEAADRLELLVSIDPFQTTTGERSHWVLPASTFAESPTVEPGDADARVFGESLVAPQHESWPDWKILRELAHHLGLGSFFPWETLAEAQAAPRVPFLRDPAREMWPLPQPPGVPPPRFATRSGKLELWSPALERFGYDPLPGGTPAVAVPNQDYPLLLITGARTRPYVNSQFRQIPSVRLHMPEPRVELHPDAARAAGVLDGMQVCVKTAAGRVVMRATVTERVHPEVVVVPAGWSNESANALTSLDAVDPISGFPELRAIPCRVERAS